ncbi:MAG: TIGR01777 family oxidoreductase, partial [Hyphomicrobiales bacterium]
KGVVLVSASGAGYYGSRGDEVLTEDAGAGDDFLARLAKEWEAEALAAAEKGVRVVVMRLGVVLGPGGGAMGQMIPAFKAFVGGPLGGGRQWFPWIHLHDLMAAVLFLIEHPELSGPVNVCAPQPVPNRDLAAALGQALKRPALVPAPAFMIRMSLGEFAEVLLASQRTVPKKLLDQQFSFKYPDIRSAVYAVVHGANA